MEILGHSVRASSERLSVPFLVLPLSSDIKDKQIKQHILEQTRVGVSADELRGNLVPALLQSKLSLGVT